MLATRNSQLWSLERLRFAGNSGCSRCFVDLLLNPRTVFLGEVLRFSRYALTMTRTSGNCPISISQVNETIGTTLGTMTFSTWSGIFDDFLFNHAFQLNFLFQFRRYGREVVVNWTRCSLSGHRGVSHCIYHVSTSRPGTFSKCRVSRVRIGWLLVRAIEAIIMSKSPIVAPPVCICSLILPNLSQA